MAEAYVIEAVRTAVGKRNGSLAKVHPIDLGVAAFRGLFDRVDVDPAAVDDVVVGCLDTIGPQAGNIGRNTWLAAGYPEEVPGVTVDRQCGSSQQAAHFAAQGVMAGQYDIVIAGGVDSVIGDFLSGGALANYKAALDESFVAVSGDNRRTGLDRPV